MYRIILSMLITVLFSLSSYADDTIVAKVNGSIITKNELEAELDRLIPKITFHRSVPTEKRKFYYDKALEELIVKELQYRDALARGMKPDKEKVDAQIEKIRHEYGLDRPMVVQFFSWLGGIFQGDFGVSISNGRQVFDDITRRIPITLHLGLLAMVISFFFSFLISFPKEAIVEQVPEPATE